MRPRTIITLVATTILAAACAKQGFPSGGPKDTEPPKIVGCKPTNESHNFAAQQFIIETDEYVVLKDVSNNVLISPPPKTKPEIATKGKGLIVKLKDTLLDNTTYLFQFKGAIADFNEGNVLESFEYVFSTGENLDCKTLAGKVVNARDGKPWSETVTVMAYKESRCDADSADTIAIWGRPDYITRCAKDGTFAFHYIPDGAYRLVALADKNGDLRAADGEAIAWDQTPYIAADSTDSTTSTLLRISALERQEQRLIKSEMTERGKLTAIAALPMQNPQPVGDSIATWRLNSKGDSLTIWLSDPTADSVRIVVSDASGLQDTIKVKYRPLAAGGRGKGRGNSAPSTPASKPLLSTLCDGTRAYYDELLIAFSTPIATVAHDTVFASATRKSDSTTTQWPITLEADSLHARINATLEAGIDYDIKIEDSLFADIYGHWNDSLSFSMKPKDYGVLTIRLLNPDEETLLIELLDTHDTVVASRTAVGHEPSIRFDHLVAGEYRLRAVIDNDGNGRWTTGSYRLQRQPEQFVMYNKTLQIREKWEMEEKWALPPKDEER